MYRLLRKSFSKELVGLPPWENVKIKRPRDSRDSRDSRKHHNQYPAAVATNLQWEWLWISFRVTSAAKSLRDCWRWLGVDKFWVRLLECVHLYSYTDVRYSIIPYETACKQNDILKAPLKISKAKRINDKWVKLDDYLKWRIQIIRHTY